MKMKQNATKILFGIAAIALGVFLLGFAFDFWNVESINWIWTLFIIIPSIGSMIASGVRPWKLLLLGIGVGFLLFELNIITDDEKFLTLLMALVLVLLGIQLIFGRLAKRAAPVAPQFQPQQPPQFQPQAEFNSDGFTPPPVTGGDGNPSPQYFALFSGGEYKNCSNAFRGGSATAVFGGLDIDLSAITLAGNAVLTANAIFGGVDIYVPDGMSVEFSGTGIFGGGDNTVPFINCPGAPVLTVKYTAVFGGVDVKTISQRHIK